MEDEARKPLKLRFDLAKSELNRARRGFGFEIAARFEFRTALIVEDDRMDYGEIRFVAIGFIDARLHVMVYTPRDDAIRVISLRKANKREIKRYAEKT